MISRKRPATKFMPWQYPTSGWCLQYATRILRREPLCTNSLACLCAGRVLGMSLSMTLRKAALGSSPTAKFRPSHRNL